METLDHLAGLLLSRLAWTSIQAVLLIGAVALIARLLPRLPAATRCMLWWLVGLQLVLGLCWQAPLELPLLAPTAAVARPFADDGAMDAAAGIELTPSPLARVQPNVPTLTPHASGLLLAHWRLLLATLWLAGLLAQLVLAIRQWRQLRAVLRGSAPWPDAAMQAALARGARALGLRRCPLLRVSDAIASPQVSGLWQPVVLVPAGHALTRTELTLALAHELAHLRRGDLWLGWLPALAQRLFFFHPLVVWAAREYALHREAACDAQVLRHTSTAPHAYGDLLLRLGVVPPIHSGLAGASPTFQNLKRRLTMLQQTDSIIRPRLHGWLLIALVALAGVLPWRVTASSANHIAVSPVKGGSLAIAQAVAPPPPPPAVPQPPTAPSAPLPPPPPPAPARFDEFSASHVYIDTGTKANEGFALFDDDSIIVTVSENDLATVKRARKNADAPLLWFRRGNAAYVIHDPSTIRQAKQVYAPVNDLARQQGRLARAQGQLADGEAGLAAREVTFAKRRIALAQEEIALAPMAMSSAGRQASAAQRQALQARKAGLEKEHAQLQLDIDAQRQSLEKQRNMLKAQQMMLHQNWQRTSAQATRAMDALLQKARIDGLAQATRD